MGSMGTYGHQCIKHCVVERLELYNAMLIGANKEGNRPCPCKGEIRRYRSSKYTKLEENLLEPNHSLVAYRPQLDSSASFVSDHHPITSRLPRSSSASEFSALEFTITCYILQCYTAY